MGKLSPDAILYSFVMFSIRFENASRCSLICESTGIGLIHHQDVPTGLRISIEDALVISTNSINCYRMWNILSTLCD